MVGSLATQGFRLPKGPWPKTLGKAMCRHSEGTADAILAWTTLTAGVTGPTLAPQGLSHADGQKALLRAHPWTAGLTCHHLTEQHLLPETATPVSLGFRSCSSPTKESTLRTGPHHRQKPLSVRDRTARQPLAWPPRSVASVRATPGLT